MTDYMLALDIGGTKTKAGIVNKAGELLESLTEPSDVSIGVEGILSAIKKSAGPLKEKAESQGDQCLGVGIATAGVVNCDAGKIGYAVETMRGWSGFPIAETVSEMFGLPATVDNDVNCALIAELKLQQIPIEHRTVMLALGTGLGGALSESGAIQQGASFLGGHFGQTLIGDLLKPDTWQQLESILSGTGLARLARILLQEQDQSVDSNAVFPNGHAVIKSIEQGNEIAKDALSRWIKILANIVHNITWNYNPNEVIIGGGMIDAKDIWWDRFIEALNASAATTKLPSIAEIRPAVSGNNAGVIGAGLMMWSEIDNV